MFLSKMKTIQVNGTPSLRSRRFRNSENLTSSDDYYDYRDVIATAILAFIMFLFNLDEIFGRYKSYKVFVILKPSLWREMRGAAFCVALACALELAFGVSPGWIYPCFAFMIYFAIGTHCHPILTLGIWAGSINLLTKKHMCYYIGAHLCGAIIASLLSALGWSFYHDIAFFECLPSMLSLAEMVVANSFCFWAAYGKAKITDRKKK